MRTYIIVALTDDKDALTLAERLAGEGSLPWDAIRHCVAAYDDGQGRLVQTGPTHAGKSRERTWQTDREEDR